jgi:hypothetical protein
MIRAKIALRVYPCLVACTCFLVWCVASPPSVIAQGSRAGTIAQEQEEKSGRLGHEGPSTGEDVAVWVQRSPLIAPTSGFFPWSRSVYPGTGVGVGAGYVKRWDRGTSVDLVAGFSTHRSTLFRARARIPDVRRGLLSVNLDASHTVANDIFFYGLGPNSSHGTPPRYDYRPKEVAAAAVLHPKKWFELSGGYGWLTFRTAEQGAEPMTDAPGLGEVLSYHVLEAGVALDWQTSPGYSTRGGSHRLTWSEYIEAQDRPFSFEKLEYEGIQLVPILREQFVLAARVMATLTTTQSADEVPFVLLPTLGDAETLRGFETRRFTDSNRLLLTGEYRWRPSRWVDMAVFFDAGKVGARRKDLGTSDLATDWGLGARFHGPTFVIFRTELARSLEGWQLIFSGGKVF